MESVDILHNLLYGFSIGLQPTNILSCFLGVLMGTLIGVLPGIGPIGAMSILLPITFKMSPVAAIIMLAGIFYGAQYGGSTTSILVNIPGEASSIITCLDGHAMAKDGRAGPALGIAAFGSFIAGTIGIVGLMIFAKPLAEFGLKFGPPEFFSVILLGLTLIPYLTRGHVIKSLMMAAFGLILGSVGLDAISASSRLTFDILELESGFSFIAIGMGLFGIGEILMNIEEVVPREIVRTKIRHLFPSLSDWMRAKGAILRGTVIGFALGMLPGGGPTISSFISYATEKKLSKTPHKFGEGVIEGVAGPESANNSASSASFIPLFTLGIPSNIIMALLFGALLIHGMQPGPLLMKEHPELFWGVVSSMYIGNVMLLILNLPLIPIWVQVLKVPYKILFPLILLFCIIGAYSLNNSIFDVFVMIVFGIVGYLYRKFEYEGAPLLLAFILGPMLELNLRQSLILSKGSALIFLTRPISAIALIIAMLLFVSSLIVIFSKGKAKPPLGEH